MIAGRQRRSPQGRIDRSFNESDARFRTLVDQLPAVVYVEGISDDRPYLYISPRSADMFGYAPEEWAARSWEASIHPDDRERAVAADALAFTTGDRLSVEYRMVTRDERTIWVRDEAEFVRDENGQPRYWQGMFLDITERKVAETSLRESEEQLQLALAAAGMGTWNWHVPSGRLRWSEGMPTLFGLFDGAQVGTYESFLDILHPDDRALVRQTDTLLLAETDHYEVPFRVPQAGGCVRWFVDQGRVVERDPAGAAIRVVGVTMDITARHSAENALRQAEARYRSLIETIPATTYIEGNALDSPTLYVSPQARAMFGYAPEEWTTTPQRDLWKEIVHPDDRERVLAEDRRCDADGDPFSLTYRVVARDGRIVWVHDEAVLVREGEGTPLHWQGVMFDVSEQKAAETALRSAEAHYRTLVEQVPAVTYVSERTGAAPTGAWRYRYVSPQIEALLGYSQAEWIASADMWRSSLHPEDRERVLTEDARTDEHGEPYSIEHRFVARDGRVVWVRDEARRIADASGDHVWQGLLIDMTVQKKRETAQWETEVKYRSLVEHLPAVTYIAEVGQDAGPAWHVRYVSPQLTTMLGYSPDEWIGDRRLWESRVHPDDVERVRMEDVRTEITGDPFKIEYRLFTRDGEERWVRSDAVLVRDEANRPRFWQGVLIDITDRKRAEQAVRESEAQFKLLFASNPHPMWVYDLNTLAFLEVNDAAIDHYGYSRDEFLRMRITEVRPEVEVARLLEKITHERPALERAGQWRHRLKDGRIIDVDIVSHQVRWHNRSAALVVAQDLTDQLALEAELAHQAFHDDLTGLPNRALFMDRLNHALDRATRHQGNIAILFLDLDDFKLINDSLGHKVGDQLLVAVAERLQRCRRSGDTVARLGGDEFIFLLEEIATDSEAEQAADRIGAELRAPFQVEGRQIVATPSIGIAFSAQSRDADDLLRQGDVAMYAAKRSGKGRYTVFEHDMDNRVLERSQLEVELRHGLEHGEFRAYYQPLVNLTTRRITRVEALVRWQHPRRGLMSPLEFIPVAEESGLIIPLGRWVLEQSCREIRAWQEDTPGQLPLGLSVNLSMRQVHDPGLVSDVERILDETRLPPRLLRLEITESVAMDDEEATGAVLRALKGLGVQLAIDDFGTGYSALSYLRRCPVDALKIDRTYVTGVGRIPEDEAIVAAIISFARTMGLEVTAEGVETTEQLQSLQEMGCDMGQGYYFARPLPPEALLDIISTMNDRAEAGDHELFTAPD